MAAIGAIRKHGVLLMIIIGIALLAFLVGDFNKLSTVFSNKNTMAKIDGNKVDDQYRLEFDQTLALFKIVYEKSTLTENENYQVHDITWNTMLEEKLYDQELKKLGITFTPEMIEEITAEMIASLKTQQPDQLLSKIVQVLAQNGDFEQAISILSNIEDYKDNPEAREIYLAYKAAQKIAIVNKKRMIYSTLVNNSVQFSDNLAKQLGETNKTAFAKFIALNPNTPAFKNITATVSEKEMKEYFKNNKKRFEVKKDARDIDLAVFTVMPSASDLRTIEDSVRAKFTRFTQTPSIALFNINEMEGTLDSTYYKKSDITIDTIAKLLFDRPVGTFLEPFNSQDVVWYYGKSFGSSSRPDSVQLAFLVVDFKTEQNPNVNRTKEQALVLKDSLQNILKAGANIFQLTPSYSGGRPATDTTMWVAERGTIASLYNSFLETPIGGFYVQDAPNAYVIYQVIAKTAPIEKRQFVLYSKEIKPSEATIKSVKNAANDLRASCTTADQLVEEANKRGIQLVQGKDITSMMASINQLENIREAISWAFLPTTELNDVSDVFNFENKMFFVASLRTIKEKGTPDFEVVKDIIEKQLVDEKKLQIISKQVNEQLAKGITLEQIAQNYQTAVADSVTLTFAGESFQNRQIENSAIGKIFNLTPGTPTSVIGTAFVYAVQLYSIGEPAKLSEKYQIEKMALRNIVLGRMRTEQTIITSLKDKMDVLDQRFMFYVK